MSLVGCRTINIPMNSVIDALNQLWRYRVNDSTWTWISGGGGDNEPRPRRAPVGWYDSLREEFWLYGGETRYTTYGSYGLCISVRIINYALY